MSEPCIRRANSLWTKCQCDACKLDRYRVGKAHRAGTYKRVTAEEAWKVVDELVDRYDWTGLAIASSCNVTPRCIQGAISDLHRHGHRTKFGPVTADRIVRHGDPTAGQVGATGSCRRLRGLARQGWDLAAVSNETGIGFSALAAIRLGDTRRISSTFYVRLRDTTNQIGLTRGPSIQTIQHARHENWPGLMAWDHIDDPLEVTPAKQQPRRSTEVDWATVHRRLAGDRTVKMTKAERFAIVQEGLHRGWSLRMISERSGIGKPELYMITKGSAA